jgi:hypothetical protein
MSGYKPSTRIGNWSEEIELQETRLQEFLKARDAGVLPSQVASSRRTQHLEAAAVSSLSADGLVHYGDTVLLLSLNTNGFLSCDQQDIPESEPEGMALTAANAPHPQRRNTFVVLPHGVKDPSVGAGNLDGQPVRFGDKVILASQMSPAHVVYSVQQSAASFSRYSHHQEVFLSPDASKYGAAWQFVFADPAYRLEFEGEGVRANGPVMLRHCATGQLLAGLSVPYPNQFGRENEVAACVLKDVHKKETKEHVWTIVMAPPSA